MQPMQINDWIKYTFPFPGRRRGFTMQTSCCSWRVLRGCTERRMRTDCLCLCLKDFSYRSPRSSQYTGYWMVFCQSYELITYWIIFSPQFQGNEHTQLNTGYVVFKASTAVLMKSSIFWDITPYSPLKVNLHFGGTYRLHISVALLATCLTLVSCLAYSSTLKMEATYASETSV
jgi:hypothetical protein